MTNVRESRKPTSVPVIVRPKKVTWVADQPDRYIIEWYNEPAEVVQVIRKVS